MDRMYLPPTTTDHLRATLGSDKLIAAIAEEIEDWEAQVPEGKHLVIMLRTPDGRVMDVGLVRPSGWQGFSAEGYIQGMPCMIVGHIATLALFCSYEETKGKSQVGFKIITDAPKESVEQRTAPSNS